MVIHQNPHHCILLIHTLQMNMFRHWLLWELFVKIMIRKDNLIHVNGNFWLLLSGVVYVAGCGNIVVAV